MENPLDDLLDDDEGIFMHAEGLRYRRNAIYYRMSHATVLTKQELQRVPIPEFFKFESDELNLSSIHVDADVLDKVVERLNKHKWPVLRHVYMDSAGIDNAILSNFSLATFARNLVQLTLANNDLGCEGVRRLCIALACEAYSTINYLE